MKFKTKDPMLEIKPLKKENSKLAWLLFKFSLLFFLVCTSLYGLVTFYNTHDFRTPILFQNPVPSKHTNVIISPVATPSGKTTMVVSDEEYIRAKFGNHGDIAVAIVKAESGLKADIVHVNNNNSVDFGCWQVNSVHLGQVDVDTLLDCKKATDWVYDNLYQDQGFNPWSAYKNGAYLAKL